MFLMSARSRISSLFGLGLIIVGATAWAGDNKSIQGTFRDTDGALLVAAEIRAERLDAKAKPVVTRTDAHGQYVFKGLPVGTYSVTAYLDGAPRSRAKVQTNSKGWAKVDFNLRSGEDGDTDVDRMQTDLRMGIGTNPGR
jgi:hypothetical protein